MTTATTNIFGRAVEELPRWVGSQGQIARIDRFIEAEGPARGARRFRLVTGGGLEVELHPDRALDLGQVTWRGVPLAWMSPTGLPSPWLAEHTGKGWLRGFGGGLLATCGLDTFGPSTEVDGVDYPMHGRIGSVPVTVTRAGIEDDQLVIAGVARQAVVFGEDLILERTWSAPLGGNVLKLRDTVRNAGHVPTGHMVLYHINVGWPLLDEGASLDIPSREVVPRDADARSGAGRWHQIEAPQSGYREQVFGHDFDDRDTARVAIDNPAINTRLELHFDTETLPAMHQWKMSGEGHYVMGLEPVNVNSFAGRAGTQAAGILPTLAPGAAVSYAIDFVLSDSLVGSQR